jgi:hypothetical protein
MPPDVVCRITQSQPPLRTRASHPHAGCAGLQPAYSDTPPGSAGFQPASSDMPPGCAGVQPACRERGLPARLQRYATWVRGLPARMPGAQALRPHTAIHPITPAPPGCAGVSPACWVRGRLARIQRCATWVRGLPARIPRYTTWVRGLPARLRRPTSEHGRPARIQ